MILLFCFPYPTLSKRWYTSFLGVGYAIITEPQWVVLVTAFQNCTGDNGFAPS
nr:MAG TPA: hypothetical protein [Caudoviricetes sp.]